MRASVLVSCLLCSLSTLAQEPMSGHSHAHGAPDEAMRHMDPEHAEVRSLRDVPLMRRGSGTSWQPDRFPSSMVHGELAGWGLMFQGLLFGGYDAQGGPRGASAPEALGWVMLMADRELPTGQLVLSLMLSPDPLTASAGGGYPLLLQSGETYRGEPLHDRQHPHDLFMELAASYTHYLSDTWGVLLYVAPAGEPALGPVAFPHRASARFDPLAVLGHHWQDSTHISFGVVTAGLVTPWAKLEVSAFNGREPDERRYDLDPRLPDSLAVRLSANPSSRVSTQVSYGYLPSPEALAPGVPMHRFTASAMYHAPVGGQGFWATTAVFGLHREGSESPTSSALLESSLDLEGHHAVFGRVEYVRKTGHDLALSGALEHEAFDLGVLALGYVYQFPPWGPVKLGVGARGAVNLVPGDLAPLYGGRTPLGGMLYVRLASTMHASAHP